MSTITRPWIRNAVIFNKQEWLFEKHLATLEMAILTFQINVSEIIESILDFRHVFHLERLIAYGSVLRAKKVAISVEE